jgi:single-strand DNA-binding protein
MNNAVFQVRVIEAPTSYVTQNPGSTTTVASFRAYVPPTGERDRGGEIACTAYGKLADTLLQQVSSDCWLMLQGRLGLPDSGPPELTIGKAWPSPDLGDDPTAVSEALNSLSLVGRAGRDPEVQFFESGGSVANLTMAVNRLSRDDAPDWFKLAIWGKQASVAADYVRKGSLLGVVGSLKFDSWTDKASGEERCRPVVVVSRLDLLGSRRDQEGGGQVPPARSGQASQRSSAAAPAGNSGGMW